MEPRRKLRVTSSSQVQGACCERIMIDRFSDLPDEIALRILNFVGQSLRSLIQLGAVSNRCRRLHLSAPSLTISSSCVSISSRLRTRLLNYWERYLFSRGDNKIENFRIFWKFDSKDGAMKRSDEFFRIATLIQNAVRCNVECLELTFTQNYLNTVVLPSCIFHCHSLMHLYVNLSGGVIQSPSSFPSYFQSLKLHDTKVSDDRFFKWISNSCKCIKDLHLFNVGGMESITIESSSLETFSCRLSADICKVRNLKIAGEKLEDVCIHWEFYSRGAPVLDRASSSRSLNIFAPKLKKLTWCGNFLNHQHLGNLTCLEYARIFLWPDVEKFSNLFEVLCSLCMVRTLLLGEHTIKAFLVEGSMPLPLLTLLKRMILLRKRTVYLIYVILMWTIVRLQKRMMHMWKRIMNPYLMLSSGSRKTLVSLMSSRR
ncbi:uncharacterized protein LOC126788017 isoform X2 [Argentina anserina]|uniref:uncharacterized protein LOC126788017 isoform X2 n=1 Tax=Argentina anserina TaxID=57926 RepID=UPI0021764C34|nr:uncharacterized protein LOC126788017 isoform X2 [Potentilla anserina]